MSVPSCEGCQITGSDEVVRQRATPRKFTAHGLDPVMQILNRVGMLDTRAPLYLSLLNSLTHTFPSYFEDAASKLKVRTTELNVPRCSRRM